MPFWPLSLIKRLTLGHKLTPAQMDQNLSDIEGSVNSLRTQVNAQLNPDGSLKNNSVATGAIQNRAVTVDKLSFLSAFYAVDTGGANALVVSYTGGGAPGLAAYSAGV